MSSLVRLSNRCGASTCSRWRNAVVQRKLNYTQKTERPDVKVSRRTTYLSTAAICISGLAFAYYVQKEKDYGNFL